MPLNVSLQFVATESLTVLHDSNHYRRISITISYLFAYCTRIASCVLPYNHNIVCTVLSAQGDSMLHDCL